MLVFGYGSLMWDRWEARFDGRRIDCTALPGYRRGFNKKSIVNWGTERAPGPTLGLEPAVDSCCIGTAFAFDESVHDTVRIYLEAREGAGFFLRDLRVVLPDGSAAQALTSVNKRDPDWYLGGLPIQERIRLAQAARGASGDCRAYVSNLRRKLRELNIVDPAVEEFYGLLTEAHPRNMPAAAASALLSTTDRPRGNEE